MASGPSNYYSYHSFINLTSLLTFRSSIDGNMFTRRIFTMFLDQLWISFKQIKARSTGWAFEVDNFLCKDLICTFTQGFEIFLFLIIITKCFVQNWYKFRVCIFPSFCYVCCLDLFCSGLICLILIFYYLRISSRFFRNLCLLSVCSIGYLKVDRTFSQI